MNDQQNPYDAVISDLRAKRDQIDQAIKLLEMLGEGISIPQPGAHVAASLLGGASAKETEISPGTFHGMNIEPAVKKLLQIRKRTMGAQEIVTDLRAGGLHLQSEIPANTITSVLTRSFNAGGDIVRVSRGQWGLGEWYPNQRFRRGVEE